MRVAALYDIHGNLPALEAVLRELQRAAVDLILVGGDVLPGPMPRESLDCLRALDTPTRFIIGNGDREVLALLQGADPASVPAAFRDVVHWNALQLGPEDAATIAGWPATQRVRVAGLGTVLFCHGTPRSDTEIFTRLTPEEVLTPLFEGLDAGVVVCGHTHMQFDRTIGTARVVNAGSVGMPFGEPGADWLLLGPAIELRHTDYNLTAAARRIQATNYPQARDFADNNVLSPPSGQLMLEQMTQASLR